MVEGLAPWLPDFFLLSRVVILPNPLKNVPAPSDQLLTPSNGPQTSFVCLSCRRQLGKHLLFLKF